LEQLWLKTANKIAESYVESGRNEKAIDWYVKICNTRPEDENANFTLMKLYAKLGYGLLVNHQYNQLEQALMDLGLEINSEIKQWHENWRHTK